MPLPAMSDGDVLMLENLRFHPQEEANDSGFAASLASLGDVYVGDAFSCTHRAHASVEALPRMMDLATAGRALGEELTALHDALASPKRPVAAIVGGAKVSTKLGVLENLIEKVDSLILGGGMANTFLLAEGMRLAPRLSSPIWSKPQKSSATRPLKVAAGSFCRAIFWSRRNWPPAYRTVSLDLVRLRALI